MDRKQGEKIRTHIEVLDKLLGLGGVEKSEFGIDGGSVFLIRGEPGAGKTTLGLQVLSQYFQYIEKQNQLRGQSERVELVFFSLERDPLEILKYANDHYGFFKTQDGRTRNTFVTYLDAQIMNLLVLENLKVQNPPADQAVNYSKKLEEYIKLLGSGSLSWAKVSTEIALPLVKIFMQRLKQSYQDEIAKSKSQSKAKHPIVLIDSLNVLLQMLQKTEFGEKIPERLLLNIVCESVREIFKDSVIIFTGEHHYRDASKKSTVSESFFCDIEAVLFTEPVAVSSDYDSEFESPLGSNVLSLLNKDVKSVQTQSFCRILKSRRTPNQTRRCAYDIVPGKGIEFYETFPGDGRLVLFSENVQLEGIWKSIYADDLEPHYPALRYDNFDRSSLQRTTAAQRRFRYVPHRTDMYLASFDNYWINWYDELCLKSNVADVLQRELKIEELSEHPKILWLLNNICANLSKTKEFLGFRREIRKLLEKHAEGFKEAFEKDVESRILPESFSLNKKQTIAGCRQLKTHDVYEEFLSGLLGKVTLGTQNMAVDPAPDTNRPCMQCLWCRSLIQRLHAKLSKENQSRLEELIYEISYQSSQTASGGSLQKTPPAVIEKEAVPADRDGCQKVVDGQVLGGNSGSQGDSLENVMAERQEGDEDGQERNEYFDEIVRDTVVCCFKTRPSSCTQRGFKVGDDPDCQWRNDLKRWIEDFILRKIFKYSLEALSQEKACLEKSCLKDRIEDYSKAVLDEFQKKIFQDLISDDLINKENDYISDATGNGNQIKRLASFPAFSASETWMLILSRVFYDIVQGNVRYRLLSPVPAEKLRLFGERRSKIITELENHQIDSNRPIHRPARLLSLRDRNMYCSIPYDANIGMIVYRNDHLRKFYTYLKKEDKNKKAYIKQVVELVEKQQELLAKHCQEYDFKAIEGNTEQVAADLVNGSIKKGYPATWEEMIAFYLLWRKEQGNSELHFLIDCLNTDSFLSTFLEFLWNCGANLRISPDYRIEDGQLNDTFNGLMRALYLLGIMFEKKIIPQNSTLDAKAFSRVYGRSKGRKDKRKQPDWVFARHWYSTIIEVLTARNEKARDDSGDPEFLWHHHGAELGVMPIPVSFSNYANYKENTWHISCWGDWHLAMVSGTENIELGVDLINNLMSSDRVCERAFANAALPTVEAFYESYGSRKCFNLPEREKDKLPDITYDQLRQDLFKHAKSRSQVFDYHHCMREFHSVLEYIHFAPQASNRMSAEEKIGHIKVKLEQALRNIQEFKDKAFLLS